MLRRAFWFPWAITPRAGLLPGEINVDQAGQESSDYFRTHTPGQAGGRQYSTGAQ